MSKQIIINHSESTITAIGNHNSSHCRPVIRLEDMKVYSSITDAAADVGCHLSYISAHLCHPEKNKSVKGMHYAYLNKVLDDPNFVLKNARKNSERLTAEIKRADENEEKARLWDQYQAELKAAADAEAKRLADEAKEKAKRQERKAKLEAKAARLNKKRHKLEDEIGTIEGKLSEVYDELEELEGDEE